MSNTGPGSAGRPVLALGISPADKLGFLRAFREAAPQARLSGDLPDGLA